MPASLRCLSLDSRLSVTVDYNETSAEPRAPTRIQGDAAMPSSCDAPCCVLLPSVDDEDQRRPVCLFTHEGDEKDDSVARQHGAANRHNTAGTNAADSVTTEKLIVTE
jgi:hypothetical protein